MPRKLVTYPEKITCKTCKESFSHDAFIWMDTEHGPRIKHGYICIRCYRIERLAYYRKNNPLKNPHYRFPGVMCIDLLTSEVKPVYEVPRPAHKNHIRIYQLIFPDHTTYVGQTSQKLSHRLRGHYRGDSSKEVQSLMPELKEVRLHEICLTREDAWSEEKQLARGLRDRGWKVLNKIFTPFGFHISPNHTIDKTGKKVGQLRCRICFEWKDKDGFHKCAGRSSGHSNQCKACVKNKGKLGTRIRKEGLTWQDAPFFARYRELRGQVSVDDFDWEAIKKTTRPPDVGKRARQVSPPQK